MVFFRPTTRRNKMQMSLFEKQKSTDWKWSMKDDYPR